MKNNNIYRITETDVRIITENIARRILKEYYDQKNLRQLWDEAIDMLGAEEFVSLLENNWDMGEIYDELIEKTGMNEEDLDAITYDEIAELMKHILDVNTQYEILDFIGNETGEFTVDDITDAPVERDITVDNFDDVVDGDEVSSEEEIEDEEEYEDPEFEEMDNLD